MRTLRGVLLIALVALAPLAIGTVHPATRAVVFAGCALAVALTLVDRLRRGKKISVTVPLCALLVAVLATAAQLVPLPARLVAWLSATTHEVLSTTRGDYGRHPLTLDTGGTWAELAKLTAYAGFLFAATIYASRPGRRRQLVLAVAATTTLVAVIGLVQLAVGSDRLLFFYTAESSREGGQAVARGPFVNPNHFGALMCLGAPCALAIGLREPRWRWAAFLSVIVINVAAVLSLSRAAIIACPLAQAITYGLDRWQLRRGTSTSSPRSGARATLVITAVASLGIAFSIVADHLAPEVAQTKAELDSGLTDPRSKFYAWNAGVELVWDYPWTGAGRGAFEQAITRTTDRGGYFRFLWIENGYLQAVIDWGVPTAALLFVLLGWSLLLAVRRLTHDPLSVGALGGVIAIAVHETVDFAVELPGVALPALAILATLFGRIAPGHDVGQRRYPARAWQLLAPAAAIAALVATFLVPTAEAHGRRLARLARDPAVPVADVLREGDRLCRRHPADYYLHVLVAERLARERHPAAMRWINLATYLNPSHPAPHLIAAELLATHGRKSQALLEYRLAIQGAPDPAVVWARVWRRYPAVKDLIEATPERPTTLALLGDWLLRGGHGEEAETVYERIVALEPDRIPVLQKLVRLAIERGDTATAATRVEALWALDRSMESRRLAARVRMLAGDLDGAAAIVDAGLDRSPSSFLLALKLAEAYSLAGDAVRARQRLDALGWQQDRRYLIQLHEARARVERRAGNEHQARWASEQAARLREP